MRFRVRGRPSRVTHWDDRQAHFHGWIEEDPRNEGELILCATNGYTSIRIPIGPDTEHAKGVVPHEALCFHDKYPDLEFTVAERHITVGKDVSFRRFPGLEFPDIHAVQPPPPEKPMRVTIDTKLLSDIAAALGSERLELVFDKGKMKDGLYNAVIHLRVPGADGKVADNPPDGVIMPVKVR